MFGVREVTIGELIRTLRSKLGEVDLLEQAIRLNGQEIQAIDTQLEAILGRMDIQRKLIHARSLELQEMLNVLESLIEEPPKKMDA